MRELNPLSGVPVEVSADTQINPNDIRFAAMNLLARREHSVCELRKKLLRRFPDGAMVDEQLSLLAHEGLQCDLRFAESYARQRIGRGYGPVRLRVELRERGVSTADLAATMEAMDIDWCAVASEVLRKKFGHVEAIDAQEQARRARFMHYRGFTAEHYQPRDQN
jgi:regulatory protein